MSDLRRLTLVTSASELADFPTHFRGRDAEELLAGWTALWHPELLTAAGSLPTVRADYDLPDPSSLEGELAIVPTMFDRGDVSTWREQFRLHPDRRLYSINGLADRRAVIAAALAALGKPTDTVDPDLVADFFAMGCAFLQVEMLTRLMRYSHLIEPGKLLGEVLAAATAAIEGQAEKARESIAAACDMLTQARNHYYPVDVHFIDIALLADSVWGAPLREELATAPWLNVLATGEQLEQLSQAEPETADVLRAALVAKPQAACFVGGAFSGGAVCDRAPETMLADFARGRQTALDTFGIAPQVFAHFNAGLAPLLPRLLSDLGFRGALLASFDGGQMPRADQCRTTWTGPDGATMNALVTTPLDAGRAETFLGIAEAISRSMDRDHVATILLAGWPGHRSPYMEDLRRLTRFGPVLGRFYALNDYFDSTVASDFGFTTKLEDYATSSASHDHSTTQVLQTYNSLLDGVSTVAYASGSSPAPNPQPHDQIETISQVLGATAGDTAILSVNAWNFERRLQHNSDMAVPHVPGLGFSITERKNAPPSIPLIEGFRLRNEFLEVLLDEHTGGIQSVHLHGQRGNLLSQQLIRRGVYRHPDEFVDELHPKLVDLSRMRVDRFAASDSILEARLTAHGHLVTHGDEPLATFCQTISLPRHSRLICFDLELEPAPTKPDSDPLGHFASRFAWRDESATVARCVQWLNLPTLRHKFSSAPWTRIDTPAPLTIIPNGNGDFERINPRMLDLIFSLEGVAGIAAQRSPERSRTFKFAVAIGEPFAAPAALGHLTELEGTRNVRFDAKRKGWWLHLPAENLVVTHLSLATDTPRTIEIRALETTGLPTHTTLRLWRPVAEAHRVSLAGEQQEPLTIADGHVQLQIAPYEWFGVRITWTEI